MNCHRCNKTLNGEKVNGYHYKESGLDTVCLDGVTVFKCENGHRLVHIPFIEKLHDAIAYDLLVKRGLLTAKEFRFIRKWIGLTMHKLAATLGVSRNTIYRYEVKGQSTAPADHSLRMLAMRIKEEACQRQMYFEVVIQELFEKMAKKPAKPAKITIDVENLPQHPSQTSQEAQAQPASA